VKHGTFVSARAFEIKIAVVICCAFLFRGIEGSKEKCMEAAFKSNH